jgi:hypothetical protein
MKLKNRLIIKAISFLFLLRIFFPVNAQEKIIWDYPIKPGTEEWKTMDYNEKVTLVSTKN